MRPAVLDGAADDYAVLLDFHLDGPVPGPMLGVDGILLDGGIEPQTVALLAVVEGSLEGAGVARAGAPPAPAAAAATTGARATFAVLGGLVVAVGVVGVVGFGAGAFCFCFGCFELGGDEGVVLGAKIDLLGVVRGAAAGTLGAASSSLTSSFWRLNCSMSRTVTSSWCATQASVRPWRTQARIWLRCGRRDFRGMDGPGD